MQTMHSKTGGHMVLKRGKQTPDQMPEPKFQTGVLKDQGQSL